MTATRTPHTPWWEKALVGIAVVGFLSSSFAVFDYARGLDGMPWLAAVGLPVLLGGLTLTVGRLAVARTDRGDSAGGAAAFFYVGVGLEAVINYAHAIPDILPAGVGEGVNAVPWVLPPLSMTLAYKLVVHERKVRRDTVAAEATRQAEDAAKAEERERRRAEREATRQGDTTAAARATRQPAKALTSGSDATRERVAQLVAERPDITQKEMADTLACNVRTIQRHLKALDGDGAVPVSANGNAAR